MNPFVSLMASSGGRALRIVAGLAIIVAGLIWIEGTAGFVVAGLGAIPLLAGLLDVCIFAPLFGNPFNGGQIRAGK